jgi:phosphatidylserine/phosphatidylglycerophosphate/cardiolipin synthase-like enzyme
MGKDHVVPAKRGENQCTITPPWFVNKSEYEPLDGSFELLINGENAFRAVHNAIKHAKKSVCIICWGFQPSMFFIRDGDSPSIGQLLEQKAGQGVEVRVLSWEFKADVTPGPIANPMNVTGVSFGLDESNTPGRWDSRIADRPPTSTDAQYAYDIEWYHKYDDDQNLVDEAAKGIRSMRGDKKSSNLHFYGRGFSHIFDRPKIAVKDHADKGLSTTTKGVLTASPSHHQKMVLVDYEDPNLAVGFVMGHNMLDEYWDKSDHSAKRRHYLKTNRPDPSPNTGPNGKCPRHDFSSRVTGPIVGDLFRNFSQAWEKRTNTKLPPGKFETYPVRSDKSTYVMGQLLRTQAQYGVEDIKNCYLQAVNNASRFIHVENQYFRWPPLAEKIKAGAAGQNACGRKPETHGPLYLFVITNSTDTGVGAGTVNTFRMLDSLGRADAIPGVTKAQRADDIDAELGKARNATKALENEKYALDIEAERMRGIPNAAGAITRTYETLNQKIAAAKAREKALEQKKATLQNKDTAIVPEERPGLKFHICTLVAPDTADSEDWIEVYIHAKLMTIDDAFMTVGSANINTRSMEVDSELNIAHCRDTLVQDARRTLWAAHTNGQGAQDDPGEAFKWWGTIMNDNKGRRGKKKKPTASLAEFRRDSPDRTDKD